MAWLLLISGWKFFASSPPGSSAVFIRYCYFESFKRVGLSKIRMTSNFASAFGFDNLSSPPFSSIPESSALSWFTLAFRLGGLRRRNRKMD